MTIADDLVHKVPPDIDTGPGSSQPTINQALLVALALLGPITSLRVRGP